MKNPRWLLVAGLAACTARPIPADTATYVQQLHPLLHENGLLADTVLEAATDVHNGRATPTTATQAWQQEVVPLASHLHRQAELVLAPPSWVDAHEELVAIWGARARGYVLVSEAVNSGDELRWKRGRTLADKAKLDEEAWFKQVNSRLQPLGLDLDQYP
jgi:hypothetical protein